MRRILLCLILICVAFSSVTTKTVLVLAATGELGSEISSFLCTKEYDLIIAARDAGKANQLIAQLKSKYPNRKFKFLLMDYTAPSEVNYDSLNGEKLDGIVVIPPRPFFYTTSGIPTQKEWNDVFSLTYSEPLEVLKRLEPFLNTNSSVVLISGITSEQYFPSYQNTNVVRLAWAGEIKNLMHQFSNKKIRVNAVSPGVILTEFNTAKINKRASDKGISFDEELKISTLNVPLKQYGQPLDVAKVVYFLLSDLSSHVNGVNLPIDGGESLAY